MLITINPGGPAGEFDRLGKLVSSALAPVSGLAVPLPYSWTWMGSDPPALMMHFYDEPHLIKLAMAERVIGALEAAGLSIERESITDLRAHLAGRAGRGGPGTGISGEDVTTVRGRWYPAAVVLPGEARPWPRCYVIAADDGLHVWTRRGETADWHASIRWDLTALPATDREARCGFNVGTAAGLAVVTAGAGCRCGVLGRWGGPEWSHVETVRR